MNHKKILSITLAIFTLTSLALTGCKKGTAEAKLDAPFTKLGWESTIDDVLETEGDKYETYDSVYEGTTYTFDKKYNNKNGTIKYMFNDKDKLMCVAWTFGSTDKDELESLYTKINNDMTNEHGDSGYNTDQSKNTVNSSGNVWYLDSGNIVLSAMNTEENKALQIAFLHPDVSTAADE